MESYLKRKTARYLAVELGTLNYEALAGFCGTEEYLVGLALV